MDAKSARKIDRLAFASRFLGILSVFIPLIGFTFAFFSHFEITKDLLSVYSAVIDVITYSGLIFGLPGYLMATSAMKKINHKGGENKSEEIISTGRTLSIIGLVIFVLFFCSGNMGGFAY